MKRIKLIISTMIIALILIPLNIKAAGSVSVSPTYLEMFVGETRSFNITANNAAGRIDINAINGGVANISQSSVFLDQQSTTVNVTSITVGRTQIVVKLTDVTTYDDESLSGKSYTIDVNVKARPVPQQPTPQQPTPQPQQPNKPVIPPAQNLSKNNNLKTLTIDGYELVKIDNNNYKLIVLNNVSNININATTEDNKAKLTGIGKQELKVGDNKITLVVTSESNENNNINIIVTRKEKVQIEDLVEIIKDESINNLDIAIDKETIFNKEHLNKVKENSKIVKLNYVDESNKLIYSWTVDGTKVKNDAEFKTEIDFTSEDTSKIASLSNYAEGKYLKFKHSGALPEGTSVKIYVGDRFKNDDIIKLYYFNKDKNILEFIKDEIKVVDGYAEFEIKHCSDYFLTMSNLGTINTNNTTTNNKNIDVFMIIAIIEFILIIALVIKMKSENKKVKEVNNVKENHTSVVQNEIKTNNIIPSNNIEPIKDTNITEVDNVKELEIVDFNIIEEDNKDN